MATTGNFVFEVGKKEGCVRVRVCLHGGGREEEALLCWYSGCQQTGAAAASFFKGKR